MGGGELNSHVVWAMFPTFVHKYVHMYILTYMGVGWLEWSSMRKAFQMFACMYPYVFYMYMYHTYIFFGRYI